MSANPTCVDPEFIPCIPQTLPADLMIRAAEQAIAINPANCPAQFFPQDMPQWIAPTPQHLAVMTSKYWGAKGVKLTVSFMDNAPMDLQRRILEHANAWGKTANVQYVLVASQGQIRVARNEKAYYAYVGTDNLSIPMNQHNVMLGGFTMDTPESEFRRVVRHEFGHVNGFPHEQQLPEIVALLDVNKTIAWGKQALGWSESMVRSQILTPIDPSTVQMTPHADIRGIMCYSLPASITKNGQPIPGGTDIDEVDAAFAAKLYPKDIITPPSDGYEITLKVKGKGQVWTSQVTNVVQAAATNEPELPEG